METSLTDGEPATKRCSSCKLPRPVGEFGVNRTKHDGLQSVCTGCKKTQDAAHYRRTKKRYAASRAARRRRVIRENQDRLWSYLREHPCVDCGEPDIVVLEFDHLRSKVMNVSAMVISGWPWARIKEEIAKCEVVCANDHRRRTARRAGWGKASLPD